MKYININVIMKFNYLLSHYRSRMNRKIAALYRIIRLNLLSISTVRFSYSQDKGY